MYIGMGRLPNPSHSSLIKAGNASPAHALPGRQKAMGEKGKKRKGFIKTRGNDGGKKNKKKNGSFKSMSWVMKIQELPVLAFITKLFLEGKAGINSVFEPWGFGVRLFVLPVGSPLLSGESRAGAGLEKN